MPFNEGLTEEQKVQISDLADGRLRAAAFADVLVLLETSSPARAAWHGLHVAADVLRGEATALSANSAKDMAFLDTFRANMAKEPALAGLTTSAPLAPINSPKPVANDNFFNWKWLGGLSAAAAIVAFSWNLVGTTATAPNGVGNEAGAQLAQNVVIETVPSNQVATPTSAGVMLRNPQLDALIAAHNQVGGSSALQMPSGFLRSATFNPAAATALGDK